MIFLFYTLCLLCSIGMFLWLYVADMKKNLCQNCMLLLMTLSDLGYLSQVLSRNLEQAILSTKIIYLGGCFLPLLYFFIICDACHWNLKKKYTVPMILGQFVVYFFVFSIGFKDWYYSSVSYAVQNNAAYLIKDYGPLHFLYPLTVYGYFAASVAVAVISIFKKKTVYLSEISDTIICVCVAVCLYFVQRMTHLKFDIMPVSYISLIVGAVVPKYHSNVFTVTENIEIVRERLNSVGFITFDKRFRYVGSNEYAMKIFKELKSYNIGMKIDKPGRELKEIMDCVKSFAKTVTKEDVKKHEHIKGSTFIIDGRTYDSEIHTLENFRGKCVGYTVEFMDETDHYKAVELSNKYQEELECEVDEKTKRIRTIQEKTILGMAQMVESRDLSTGGHIRRTSDVVKIFSERLLTSDLGFDERFLEMVVRAAPMHDLGKIGVDDAILRKQGKFTDEEYEKMKKHSEIGYKIVTDILTGVEDDDFVKIAQNVAHYHHEKMNGKGYPDGLSGEEIPMEARIMALADVFDALVSKRCYKDAFSYDDAFNIIQKDSGTHFDARLVPIFLSCRKELEFYYDNCDK